MLAPMIATRLPANVFALMLPPRVAHRVASFHANLNAENYIAFGGDASAESHWRSRLGPSQHASCGALQNDSFTASIVSQVLRLLIAVGLLDFAARAMGKTRPTLADLHLRHDMAITCDRKLATITFSSDKGRLAGVGSLDLIYRPFSAPSVQKPVKVAKTV